MHFNVTIAYHNGQLFKDDNCQWTALIKKNQNKN